MHWAAVCSKNRQVGVAVYWLELCGHWYTLFTFYSCGYPVTTLVFGLDLMAFSLKHDLHFAAVLRFFPCVEYCLQTSSCILIMLPL